MSELDQLIQFWKGYQVENINRFSRYYDRRVKETIAYLEKLRKLKGECAMTIDEAIEIKEDKQGLGLRYDDDELDEADRLSIEALKEVKKARYGDPALDGELLPGETEKEEGE